MEAQDVYRPGVSEVGECCTTCQFYTWGDQTDVAPHYVHGYCRAYMVITGDRQVCDFYRRCPACNH
jgi:hypothetical protein